MNRPEADSPAARERAQAAADWLVKRDRTLTAEEQDEFSQWLAADPRHGEWLALHRRTVGDFACLAQWRPEHSEEPNPDLLARPQRRLRWLIPVTLTVAAGFAVALVTWQPWTPDHEEAPALIGGYERRILEDGSTVELNRGAVIAVEFSAGERRVALVRGEALFTVAKNPVRPFVVSAGGVGVRAIGTAFNVRLAAGTVEVLVTHGQVQVESPVHAAASVAESPRVAAGHRAIVSLAAATAPQITSVSPEETARLLAWQPQLLDFSSVPLHRVVEEFNRRNRVQLRLADDALAGVPIVASIRSDNVEGLIRFLTANAGVNAESRDGEIWLRRK